MTNAYGEIYSDAIPIEKLIGLAKEEMKTCNDPLCEKTLRRHAEKIVLANVCICVTTAAPIIDAVVEEYLRQMTS